MFSIKAFLFGVIGDFFLQVINKNSTKGQDWGLDYYFEQHQPIEALAIAGVLTSATLFTHDIFFQRSLPTLFFTGMVWDIVFRNAMIMPSLKQYYAKLNWMESILWAGGPAMLMINM